MHRLFTVLTAALLLTACTDGREESAPVAKPVETERPASVVVAEIIYTNGKIYTVNERQPWAEALAVKGGKFLAVGSNEEIAALTGSATKVIDLGGKFAMPGLIDAHNHATGASMGKANLYVSEPNDADAMLAEIKAYAEANPDLPFIRGEAWNLGVFSGNSPRKEWLDEIVPDRPVYFYSQTGHDAWVNSKTLELIGLTKNSERNNKFVWDADPDTGEPSGTIREYTMSLVEQALPPTAPERIVPALAATLAKFSESGFTTLKLAEGEVTWVQAANQLDRAGELNVRLFPSWFHRAHTGAMTPEESFEVAARWKEFETERVVPRYVKMYADGSSGSHSTLLLEPYTDRPGDRGSLSFPYGTLVEDFTRINQMGLGLIVHVFGDGSSAEIIEAFEEVRQRNGDNGVPLHFSHSFMTSPDQIQRLAQIPDVCMDFMTLQYPHPAIRGAFTGPIGEERYQKWLNVRAATEAGMPYAFGSDWPASLEPVLNGFFQMQGFITRRDPRDPDYGTLNPGQAITLEQAVYGFTLGGAECLGFDWPQKLGSVEAGKLADFIVLDRNLFEIPVEELHLVQVDKTIVGGQVVFDRDQAVAALDVVKVEITNSALQGAIDAAELNLLVEDELSGGSGCFAHDHEISAGAPTAPDGVNEAFSALPDEGYRFARPAREIHWQGTGRNYWIQWTLKDNVAVLWAFDPEQGKVTEVMQIKE